MRRPIQILPDHFDTSSQDPVLLDDLEDEIDVSEVYNHETKKMLCQLLTSQCQLAVVLTPLITTVYPPSGFESSVVDFGTKLVRIENVKARLRYWETNEVVQVPSNQNLHTSVAFYSQLTSLYFE